MKCISSVRRKKNWAKSASFHLSGRLYLSGTLFHQLMHFPVNLFEKNRVAKHLSTFHTQKIAELLHVPHKLRDIGPCDHLKWGNARRLSFNVNKICSKWQINKITKVLPVDRSTDYRIFFKVHFLIPMLALPKYGTFHGAIEWKKSHHVLRHYAIVFHRVHRRKNELTRNIQHRQLPCFSNLITSWVKCVFVISSFQPN